MDLESIAESSYHNNTTKSSSLFDSSSTCLSGVGVSVAHVDNPRQPTIQEMASITSSSASNSSHWISYGSNDVVQLRTTR